MVGAQNNVTKLHEIEMNLLLNKIPRQTLTNNNIIKKMEEKIIKNAETKNIQNDEQKELLIEILHEY